MKHLLRLIVFWCCLGGVSTQLDSDGDGLTDYEETNGMRLGVSTKSLLAQYPLANFFLEDKSYGYVFTNPEKQDSDDDSILDGVELGQIQTSNTILSGSKQYYPLVSDPTSKDNLVSALLIPLNAQFYRSTREGNSLIQGAAFGAGVADDPTLDPLFLNLGWTAAFLAAPELLPALIIRDAGFYASKGDSTNAGLTLLTAAPAGRAVKLGSDAAKPLINNAISRKLEAQIAQLLIKASESEAMPILRIYYKDAAASLTNVYRISEATLVKYGKNKIDLNSIKSNLDDLVLHDGATPLTAGNMGEINANVVKIERNKAGPDVVATLQDGRTIARELKVVTEDADVSTKQLLSNKLKNEIEEAGEQLSSHNSKELYVQINPTSSVVTNENLKSILDSLKTTPDFKMPDRIVVL